jgi:hypothetical protein
MPKGAMKANAGPTRKFGFTCNYRSLLLCAVLFLALVLRIWGIGWGLPNQERILSYHPDEGPNLVLGVLDNGVLKPHLDLGFYNYGSLYFYLWQGAAAINQTYGFVRLPPTGSPDHPITDSPAAIILMGRYLTVALSVLTVLCLYKIGERLYGYWGGIIASGCFAVAPGVVMHSHYATVDIPSIFFIVLCLLFTMQFADDPANEPISWKYVMFAGLTAGFAAATKYSCLLVILSPLAMIVWRGVYRKSPWVLASLLLLSSCILGFLIGCPGVLLDSHAFFHDFFFELRKSGEGMGLLFVNTGNGWFYPLHISLPLALGYPLLLLSIIGVFYPFKNRKPEEIALAVFFVAYYGMIAMAKVRFFRYALPLIPILCIYCSRLFSPTMENQLGFRRALRVVAAGSIFVALFISLAIDHSMCGVDPRDQAIRYLSQYANQGKSVAFATTPWYYTPPFSPWFTAMSVQQRRTAADKVSTFKLILPAAGTEWDNAALNPPPDFCVLSNLESSDALRLREPDALQFMKTLRTQYNVRVFENPPSLFGVKIRYHGYVPVDWLYANPVIYVYSRDKA